MEKRIESLESLSNVQMPYITNSGVENIVHYKEHSEITEKKTETVIRDDWSECRKVIERTIEILNSREDADDIQMQIQVSL